MKKLFPLLFLIILLFASFTRLYGNNWDQGQHLNPDERFLTMVATNMSWPASLSEYLDTSNSKLNPHNIGYDFFVYGTWPVIFVKWLAELFHKNSYGELHVVGRITSGLADILTLIVVFLITKRLMYKNTPLLPTIQHTLAGLLAMTAYTLMALPIQLSHFFTTDPYLTLFLTLSIYSLLFSPSIIHAILLGTSVGLALSAKISGFVIFPTILLYIIYHLKSTIGSYKRVKINIVKFTHIVTFCIFFTVFLYLSLRLFMPYFFISSDTAWFTINTKVLDNIKTLQAFNNKEAWFPPAVQWINTTKILFPLLHIILVGLGIPLGLLSISAIVWSITKIKQSSLLLIPISFCLILFIYQGIQFNMPMRYFYPMYPMLAVLTGLFLHSTLRFMYSNNSFVHKITRYLFLSMLFFIPIWPLSFLTIYSKNHSRIQASLWIYKNIPQGSNISYEHWDDPLPLNLPNYPLSTAYSIVELPMYAEDTPEKWKILNEKINTLDYIILSSNRVYGSITSASKKFPLTTQFYEQLFSGALGFHKVAEFTSRPSIPFPYSICISLPWFNYGYIDTHYSGKITSNENNKCNSGLEFIDDYVDETWTVYDHPKVGIFKKNIL